MLLWRKPYFGLARFSFPWVAIAEVAADTRVANFDGFGEWAVVVIVGFLEAKTFA